MSKAECVSFLQSHPGKHTIAEISRETDNNLESCRHFMTRLKKDGAVHCEYPARANQFIMWWV
ncbi:hypothetical protein M0R72_07050 [Candidatus Pacearchaeota archaeon]|jgi:DNA-binding IscR family transcriptional regulator|nr:hypothetical protein [Candidatus Pacearchaeota archaeon]